MQVVLYKCTREALHSALHSQNKMVSYNESNICLNMACDFKSHTLYLSKTLQILSHHLTFFLLCIITLLSAGADIFCVHKSTFLLYKDFSVQYSIPIDLQEHTTTLFCRREAEGRGTHVFPVIVDIHIFIFVPPVDCTQGVQVI